MYCTGHYSYCLQALLSSWPQHRHLSPIDRGQPLIKPGPTQGSVGSAGCCWVALTGISVLVLVLIAAVVVLNYTGHTDWVDLGEHEGRGVSQSYQAINRLSNSTGFLLHPSPVVLHFSEKRSLEVWRTQVLGSRKRVKVQPLWGATWHREALRSLPKFRHFCPSTSGEVRVPVFTWQC